MMIHEKKSKNDILKKIRSREAKVAVIGLGYVGLPLAIEFAKAGSQVVVRHATSIFDARNALRNIKAGHVEKL